MNLNLKELLVGTPTRLRYVVRFSTCHKVHPENVAEHSYYVALYAMWIADWVEYNEKLEIELDVEQLLRGAILHDLEEAVSGDVNRIFKYATPEVAYALHKGGEVAYQGILDNVFPGWESGNQRSRELETWQECKDERYYIGRILRFADFLSVLSYMMQELTNANITMREHWKTMYDYISEFDDVKYDFLRPMVEQAHQLMADAFQALPPVPGENALDYKEGK
jgi:5'-deoxynucleotidase YfbR-like HD superfamily hydrolase